ncbi:hypothetical protein C5188_06780 [Serratia liquefaciens]|uniref:hypothetical protein n=1 Tax=Serratia liquefaciens TaxID=614 RepID=UPI000D50ED77|nr:hypothetical protein [Serratia liquefaciens]PVD44160.1 hypothetical protein C5188_06780 [Serratia liquefaciens]QHT51209.1 hypothetical protein C5686_013080 [Serratia liquefaciens]
MKTKKENKYFESDFDWCEFSDYIISSYGSFEHPDYLFTHQWFAEERYPEILAFIKENYQSSEDMEPNTDVSYGFIIKKDKHEAVLKLSFIGPYFYISSILSDGNQSEPTNDLPAMDFRFAMQEYLHQAGFICTTSTILCNKVLFGGRRVSLYKILYCYEDEPSWIK